MKGAIDIIKGWREICKQHTYTGNNGVKTTVYSHCCNCKLQRLCKRYPRELTDEDILDLVNKIGGVK